jgi:hypothetical protein
MHRRSLAALAAGLCLTVVSLVAQTTGAGAVQESDLRRYLTYLSSDELTGREVFTEGYGVASQYVADELKAIGVKPLGDHGTYFQMVRLNDVRITSDNSSVTVTVHGVSKTFREGQGVELARPAGGKQTLTFTEKDAEFLGYADSLKGHDDFAGKQVRGKAVVWTSTAPAGLTTDELSLIAPDERSRHLLLETFAGASIAYAPSLSPEPDTLRTVEKFDRMIAPDITASDEFFAFLLSGTPGQFDKFKAAAISGAPLPPISLAGVQVVVNIAATYEITNTRLTRNVVGMVDGADPVLKNTYVMFGAHLDHVGTATNTAPRGRVNNPIETDKIWNGADDDGSGSAGMLGIAKTFATGPKPKRSVVFVWHTGEEAGLYGSLYNADFPVVPLDKVVAQLNIDMIGRDRDNDSEYANTVYVIGADRISTDLHNAVVRTNDAEKKPLTLDFEYNDPADPEAFYYRSDHFSYAAKDVPIAFFFTGTHPDYHANSDSVEKIHFDKMTRIAQMVYQAGFNIANNPVAPAKDHLGPRAGKGFAGVIK